MCFWRPIVFSFKTLLRQRSLYFFLHIFYWDSAVKCHWSYITYIRELSAFYFKILWVFALRRPSLKEALNHRKPSFRNTLELYFLGNFYPCSLLTLIIVSLIANDFLEFCSIFVVDSVDMTCFFKSHSAFSFAYLKFNL